jgi:hypothetical protein
MRHQKAYFFIPDPRLRTYAAGEQRRQYCAGATMRRRLHRRARRAARRHGPRGRAVSSSQSSAGGGRPTPRWCPTTSTTTSARDDVDGNLTIDLTPPPLPGGGTLATATHHRTRREHKAHLRADNAERARDIVRVSGLTHAQVNGELNRLSGVGKGAEATVEQLENRLRHADRWLSRL